jgi:hypothetical protein
MRFGGHETFAVRPGWLSRGLRLVDDDPGSRFDDLDVADALGVGRNMARSIRHWLQVTGVVRRGSRDEAPGITPLGRLILDRDPFLQLTGTWWALHVMLVTRSQTAVAWRWFFNEFTRERFDRLTCIDELTRALERTGERLPSANTLSREVGCLLNSYALPLPAEPGDPEDATDCPFRRLGLVVEHRDTGVYERRFTARALPPELLGFVLARWLHEGSSDYLEVPFARALAAPHGPGRVLALGTDGLARLVDEAEHRQGADHVHTYLLGAERMIRARSRPIEAWLEGYYDRTDM